jgi:hypothetical protein
MTDERGVLRRIAWRELFPWLIIFRTFRLSISPTLLAVATLAVALSYVGSSVGRIFLTEKERELAVAPSPPLVAHIPPAVAKYLPAEGSSATEGYFRLADPFYRIFRREMSLNYAAYYVFVSLWSLAIWAMAGGIITRRAIVEFGADETPGIVETVKFVSRRYLWYFLSPLYPLCGVLLLMLPIAALGLIARVTDLGVVLAGLAWILVIIAGLVAAWLLAGLLFGFPLMWGTLSAERDGDAFEAFSRSFSYVYGKPLHYLFYAVIAALFGALCWAVVDYAASLVIEFGFWAYSWGAGGEKTNQIVSFVNLGFGKLYSAEVPHDHQVAKFGALLITLVIGLVRLVEAGFIFSFFWCAAGAIYLLLRQDVDDKELDEVYLPAETPAPKGPLQAAATRTPEPTPAPVPTTSSSSESDQRLIETVQAPPQ